MLLFTVMKSTIHRMDRNVQFIYQDKRRNNNNNIINTTKIIKILINKTTQQTIKTTIGSSLFQVNPIIITFDDSVLTTIWNRPFY
jgi:hypothetical protein